MPYCVLPFVYWCLFFCARRKFLLFALATLKPSMQHFAQPEVGEEGILHVGCGGCECASNVYGSCKKGMVWFKKDPITMKFERRICRAQMADKRKPRRTAPGSSHTAAQLRPWCGEAEPLVGRGQTSFESRNLWKFRNCLGCTDSCLDSFKIPSCSLAFKDFQNQSQALADATEARSFDKPLVQIELSQKGGRSRFPVSPSLSESLLGFHRSDRPWNISLMTSAPHAPLSHFHETSAEALWALAGGSWKVASEGDPKVPQLQGCHRASKLGTANLASLGQQDSRKVAIRYY